MTEIDVGSKPRLARGVRLRLDHINEKLLLLRPEQGFELQGSASEVVKLCTAKLTVAEIVDRLTETYRDVARDLIAQDVARLLAQLTHRGLIIVGDEP